jgi:cold shock CspA family protein
MSLTFAVLVDGENTSYMKYSALLEEVEKYGTVAIKWVYADWTSVQHRNWHNILHKTASIPKQQFQYGKDAADHALVMDAIELINNNQRISGVCIVSSDGGFYSLAQRIREKGLHVMAIGKENTPERFIKACHNFVFTKNLIEQVHSGAFKDVNALLVTAYMRCVQSNEPVYLGDLGSSLKMLDSSFDFRNYRVTSLKALIKEKPNLFEVVDESHDRCFIRIVKNQGVNNKGVMSGVIRMLDKNRGFGFITSDDGDFHFNTSKLLGSVEEYEVGTRVSFRCPQAANKEQYNDNKCPSVEKVAICN